MLRMSYFLAALALTAPAVTIVLAPGRAEATIAGATHYSGTFSGTASGTSINSLFFNDTYHPNSSGPYTNFTNAPITGTIDYNATRITQILPGGGTSSFVVTQDLSITETINGRTVRSNADFTNTPTVYYSPGGYQSIVFYAPAAAPVEGYLFLQIRANVPFLVDDTTMQEISLNGSELYFYSGDSDFLPRLNNSDPGGYVATYLTSFELHAVKPATDVPEPASMTILGIGLVATIWRAARL